MLNIIFLLVVGSALTYIAKDNLELVTVNMGSYTLSEVPLFYVIVGALLAGLILSYIFHKVQNIAAYLVIWGKSKEIRASQEKILDLTKTIHQLELQNEKLKKAGPKPHDGRAL